MQQLPDVVRDRGSKYAVSGGVAASREDADAFLAELKRDKKFAKATHNTWAVILSDGTPLKGDDGESGAGNVILRMLERDGVTDRILVVTRWYSAAPRPPACRSAACPA